MNTQAAVSAVLTLGIAAAVLWIMLGGRGNSVGKHKKAKAPTETVVVSFAIPSDQEPPMVGDYVILGAEMDKKARPCHPAGWTHMQTVQGEDTKTSWWYRVYQAEDVGPTLVVERVTGVVKGAVTWMRPEAIEAPQGPSVSWEDMTE